MKLSFTFKGKDVLSFREGFKKPFLILSRFFSDLRKSYLLMSKWEKIMATSLLVVAFGMIGGRYYQSYILQTKVVPAEGGVYREAVFGEVKYLNPTIAQNDAEKAISHLLFSGLVHVGEQSAVAPDIASSWNVSEDGRVYTFNLRTDVLFSDGVKLTADDVAFTIDNLRAPGSQSPLATSWSNVEVKVVDENTIEFVLPKVYGPFIYNCTFGILPAHMSSDDFAKKLVGTGPYKYLKSKKSGSAISEIELERNTYFYGIRPLVSKVKLDFFSDQEVAKNNYETNKEMLALYGTTSSTGKRLDFESSRRLGLIANIRTDKMKDKNLRQVVFGDVTAPEMTKLDLITLDASLQRQKAEDIKSRLRPRNIDLNIIYLSSVKLQDAITARTYDLLLYGFDFGYDRDPYTFWHSSQADSLNFSGWSDKASDILLEDARMLTDISARNAKYDQFFNTIKTEYLAYYYDPIEYTFTFKDGIMGVQAITGNQGYSRYDNIAKWYIEEQRVKK